MGTTIVCGGCGKKMFLSSVAKAAGVKTKIKISVWKCVNCPTKIEVHHKN